MLNRKRPSVTMNSYPPRYGSRAKTFKPFLTTEITEALRYTEKRKYHIYNRLRVANSVFTLVTFFTRDFFCPLPLLFWVSVAVFTHVAFLPATVL